MTTPNGITDDTHEERWPPFSRKPLRWVAALDKEIERIDHRDHVRFISITNALEVQFEQGAAPAVVRLLLRALLATARDSRVAPTAFGIDDDADRILASIEPGRRRSRGR